MAQVQKPLPMIVDWTKPYWEATKRHELLLLRCIDCGQHRHPMAAGDSFMCPNCTSTKQPEWVKASGRGKVMTWTVVHRVFHPAFADEAPYVVVIVLLEEGARIIANLRGIQTKDIKADMDVEVFFEELSDEITLPQFRPPAT